MWISLRNGTGWRMRRCDEVTGNVLMSFRRVALLGWIFLFLGEGVETVARERGPLRCVPFPGTPHSATRRGRRGYFARRADVWGLRVPGPDAMNCCQRFHVALWLGRRYGPGCEPHQQPRPPSVHGRAGTG